VTAVTMVAAPRRLVELTVDGESVCVLEGATILDACRQLGIATPTLCYGDTLHPVNVCRVCVVEVEGARTLVPSCSRKAEPGMVVQTDSERVRLSRRLVLELLGSSVDLSTAPDAQRYIADYEARPERFGPDAATVAQGVKVDNDLYVRDYSKCILCYKCVEACGVDHQNTFAIAVAGRGFEAHISTELDVPLPDSACVYCGNCIAVCPASGTSRGRSRCRRSAPTAASAATSSCTCRTATSSRSPRRTTTTSRAATSASRAASASSSSRTAPSSRSFRTRPGDCPLDRARRA
jgi:predicted molibdopterin-dependent oxidoreductase YjgC